MIGHQEENDTTIQHHVEIINPAQKYSTICLVHSKKLAENTDYFPPILAN